MKWCPTCSTVKRRDEFYLNTARADGLQYMCKLCQNNDCKVRNRIIREAKPIDPPNPKYIWVTRTGKIQCKRVITDDPDQVFRCTACEHIGPWGDFKRTKKGRVPYRCRPCQLAYERERYAEDPQAKITRTKAYYHQNRFLIRVRNRIKREDEAFQAQLDRIELEVGLR